MDVSVGILTISDRSSRNERLDTSGPALASLVTGEGWAVTVTRIVPDEIDQIKQVLIEWTDQLNLDLIITTGGTGFALRDVTPEATRQVIQKEAPGLAEAMRSSGLKTTPHAMLSRSIAGIRNQTLIINLPGNPKAASENLEVVWPALPHAIQLLQDQPDSEKGHATPG
jgi:molybdenum cofactor synthesis domain-containing protein